MIIYEEVEQQSEEWYKLRSGRFTASYFHTLMGESATKENILLKKTAERLNPNFRDDFFITKDIERGIELESQARLLYEMQTGNEIKEIGFCEVDDFVGCSPDGLIGEDGIIEIKSPKDNVFIEQVIKDKIKPEYYTQIQYNLYCLDRNYCDYIAYNVNYPLFIKRIERDETYIEKIKKTIEQCKTIVLNNIELFNERLLINQ